MINIEQVKKDFDNGVIISRETIRQVIEMAAESKREKITAYFYQTSEFGPWIECGGNEPGCIRFAADMPTVK